MTQTTRILLFFLLLGLAASLPRSVQAEDESAPAPRAPSIDEKLRASVQRNPLIQRLSTLSVRPRFIGGAKGANRWMGVALGKTRKPVPVTLTTPRGNITAYAASGTTDLWIAGAMVRNESAILRIGDLLPLLAEAGIRDRQTSLAVVQIRVGAGVPPSYTLSFRPGALYPHRKTLAAGAERGRLLYSLTTGRLTVLGSLVMVNSKGDLRVTQVSTEGDQTAWIQNNLTPKGCRDLETALRSEKPDSALQIAATKIGVNSMTQVCAARYLALIGLNFGTKNAVATLRGALRDKPLVKPRLVVEALVAVSSKPEPANVAAVAAMVKRHGPVGAVGVCEGAPLSWTDKLLERKDLGAGEREILSKCAWR